MAGTSSTGGVRSELASAVHRLRRRPDPREERARFVEQAAQFTPYVAVEVLGMTFLVSTVDRKMAKFFAKRTRPDLRVLNAALAHLDAVGLDVRKTTFVDGGANIGTTTLAALNAGFSHVLAFEPEPSNARLLRANVALNGVHTAVRVVEAGLSDRAGSATLQIGCGSLSKARLVGPAETASKRSLEIQLVRLDDLAADGSLDPASVGLLWLDVEGHEYQALEGATAVLSHSPPLVMELSPQLLRHAGGIERLPGLLARHYTHVADLRRPVSGLVPVERFPELIERYDQGHTDVLLWRTG